MTDFLIEQLVKKNATAKDNLKKTGLFLVTALSVLLVFIIPYAVWVTMILVIVDYILIRRMDVEYEYIYYNGDLDIDKIMNKESRKRVFSTKMDDVIVIAPSGTQEVLGYEILKAIDLSTCTPGNKTYELVTTFKGEKVRVIFEPNEKMLEAMKNDAPRKVHF